MEEACARCGKTGDSLWRCTGCWTTRYCSTNCQKCHWPQHKGTCVKLVMSSPQEKPETSERTEDKETEARQETEDDVPEAAEEKQTKVTTKSLQYIADGDLMVDGKGVPFTLLKLNEEEPAEGLKTCQKCKVQKKDMKTCNLCESVTYCSYNCQISDWSSHKVQCAIFAGANDTQETKSEGTKTEKGCGSQRVNPPESHSTEHKNTGPAVAGGMWRGGERMACPADSGDLLGMVVDFPPGFGSGGPQPTKTAVRGRQQATAATTTTTTTTTKPASRAAQAAALAAAAAKPSPLKPGQMLTLFPAAMMKPKGVITWQEAKSRAAELHPDGHIIDNFNDLDLVRVKGPMVSVLKPRKLPGAVWSPPVAVLRLISPMFNPVRHQWRVEDITGDGVVAIFCFELSPETAVKFSQLRTGNFLCIWGALLEDDGYGFVGFHLMRAADLRIIEPRH